MNVVESPVDVIASARHADARYRALVDVASVVASHTTLPDLLRSLRGQLQALLPFDFLAVGIRDDDCAGVALRHVDATRPLATDVIGRTCMAERSYAGRALRSGRTVHVPRLHVTGPEPSALLVEHGIASFCAIPLATARGTVGVLNFGSSLPEVYSAGDVEFMERVAQVVAVAVENVLHLERIRSQQTALQRERDQLDLLLDVTNAVITQHDVPALFAAVAPALRRCCNADVAALTIYDADAKVLRKHVCDVPGDFCSRAEPRPEITLTLDGSPSGVVFTTGKPRIFSAAEIDAYPDTGYMRGRIRSACSVPLATPQAVLGTLDLGARVPDAFSPEQFDLLARVAGQIAIAVNNAWSYRRIEELNAQLAREKLYLQDEIRSEYGFEEIIGRSTALRRVLREVQTVAPTDSTVLISGETGSGKELVARAIHQLSERRDNAFVKLNCAAIPTGLLESELFGHEKGAFTGAIAQRIGRFELAHRGTVFLDEVGEIPLELQPKLLRVLQEREFERLGSARTLRTDARLIAATNRELAALVGEQKFREDLFYRLNVFPVHIPPLRERREDVPMLVRHFVQQFARRMKKTIEAIPAETMDALAAYDWPGNIRELQNLVERAVILTSGPTLDVPAGALNGRRHAAIRQDDPRPPQPTVTAAPPHAAPPHDAGTLEDADRRHILAALEASRWVIGGPQGAAARLGLKRSTLQFRMRKLGIVRPAR